MLGVGAVGSVTAEVLAASEEFDQVILADLNLDRAKRTEKKVSSDKVVVVADHTKLGAKSSFFFAAPGDLSLVITDADADPAFLGALAEHDVATLVAPRGA